MSLADTHGLSNELPIAERVHLLSNLLAFVTPRVPKLPKGALEAYVSLLADLLHSFPSSAFDPNATVDDDDSEEETDGGIRVRIVDSFEERAHEKMPDVDPKTNKRIQSLVSGANVNALTSATSSSPSSSSQLYRLLLAAFQVWPTKKEALIDLLWAGGGIVKDLWRGSVRSSGLGREGTSEGYDVFVPHHRVAQDPWPALLLLCEIYTQVLGSMGDDEFFASSSASSSGATGRNPLTVDDVRVLSKMVLNIVWVMYNQPPPPLSSTTTPPPLPLITPQTYYTTRGTLTTLLRALHARDARRGYVPENHWIKLPSGGGWESFVEAALVEEEHILLAEQGEADEDGGEDPMDVDYPTPIPNPSLSRIHQNQTSIRARRAREHLAKHQRILQDIPFAVPFELRVRVFRAFVVLDGVIRRARGVSSSRSFGASRSGLGAGVGTGGSSQSVREALLIVSNPSLGAIYTHRGGSGKKRVEIRRGHVSEDGFDKLHLPTSRIRTRAHHIHDYDEDGWTWTWKHPLEIAFIDQWGAEEAGIDGGGLFKEFFTELSREVFDPRRGLWASTSPSSSSSSSGGASDSDERAVYPRPSKSQEESYQLEWYNFVGRVVGKAMYEGILVDVVFARFFLARWLASATATTTTNTNSHKGTENKGRARMTLLDDLRSLDEEVWRGLVFLKNLSTPAEVEALGLRFCVDVEEFGETITYDLMPNGSQVPVTKDNRMQYIYLLSHFKLIKQLRLQSTAFFKGISELIEPRWVRMFTPRELSNLISGAGAGVGGRVDVDDLRRWTRYGGLYSGFDGHDQERHHHQPQHPQAQQEAEKVVEWFWDVVAGFGEEERRGLLKFVTSCSRPPLLGFKELNPHFAIRDAGEDQDRLPTASTCVNLLKLPRYRSPAILRAKLLQAINSGAGFDLS